ncbi:sugar transferase [Deinococcus frigens]|uniref:sugar transferase n=1 Tax=Deinococcus frigens TaxID=249403 RepID=UPI000AE07E02|nr:sugar transferase [Deinococcus frigens]
MPATLDVAVSSRILTRDTPPIWSREQVKTLAALLDLCGLIVVALCFWWWTLAMALPADERSVVLKVWLLIGVLSSLLSRLGARHTIVQRPNLALYTPGWAFLISLAVSGILGLYTWLPVLLVVHAIWLLCIIGLTWMVHRLLPPLRLGTFAASAGTSDELTRRFNLQTSVEFVSIGFPYSEAFTEIDGLLVDSAGTLHSEQQRFVEHAQVTKVPLWSWAQFEEEVSGQVPLNLVQPDWLNQASFDSRYSVAKRIFDVVFTVLALPLLLPLMAVVALIVFFNSGAPILFWQERVGRNNETFKIVKFRTMTRDSERSGPAFAQHGDLRVTPVGALLRKFRLDELPQFWNVMIGQMSIIGPRPEQQAFAADFEESIPLYATRHWVRPGITGWAQVNQGYAADVGQTMEKLRYDFYYVKHFSTPLDLLIVVKTLWTILTGFGAR